MPEPFDVERMFAEYDRHPGDRERLLSSAAAWHAFERVLYPGSYIDISPSFVFQDVTYVDTDRRAARFFEDRDGVDTLMRARYRGGGEPTWRFLHADYTEQLDVPDGSVDLLLSLYAGFVSRNCSHYLRPGGCLLANNSHGDASMASLDPRYRLVAVVTRQASAYRVREEDIAAYLEPRDRNLTVTREHLERTGRGVRYTRPAAAYVFRWLG